MSQLVESSLQQLFSESISNYLNNEFQEALKLINKCIKISPQSSDLLTNRALIKAKMEKFDDAIKDLQKAIQYSPYHYVPYFNLSSVYYKKGMKLQTLQNICCSISCLYVSKCRFTQDLSDISRSLFYSNNNIQAHVLKGLINLKKGNQKLALNSLDKAIQYDKSNKILKQIHSSVYKQLFPYHSLENYPGDQQNIEQKPQNLRLKCTYQQDQCLNIDHLIDQKMQEFNELLRQVKQLQSGQESEAKQIRVVNQFWDQGEDKTFEIRKSHRN